MRCDDEGEGEGKRAGGDSGAHEVVPLRRGGPTRPPGSVQDSRVAEDEEVLRVQLGLLKQEHRDMDAAIDALQRQGGDPFTIKRLKTQKLRLKDRIARIEDELNPDIIA